MKTQRQFYIIDTGVPGADEGNYTASGPYASVAAAEKYLRKEGAAIFASSDTPLNHSNDRHDWASPCHIVELVKTVQQVPVVTVTCNLVSVKEERR